MAGQCQKLKFNRRRLHMNQQQFADLVGVSVKLIDKLERDEDAWDTLPSETSDKIYAQYGSMASYRPAKEEAKEVLGVVEKNDKKPKKQRGAKCERLLAARTKMGLTQVQLGKSIGLNFTTINKLENDETAWSGIKSDTADKIMRFYDSISSNGQHSEEVKEVKPERKLTGTWADRVLVNSDGSIDILPKAESDLVEIVEDPKTLTPIDETKLNKLEEVTGLSDKDRLVMKYVEFACGQLKESKSHEDFETNIDILTRIIKKQY